MEIAMLAKQLAFVKQIGSIPVGPGSPPLHFPIWLPSAVYFGVIAVLAGALAHFLSPYFGACTAFVMTLPSGILSHHFYKKLNQTSRKSVKLRFDLSANLWTVVTTAFLTASWIGDDADLKSAMNHHPVIATLLFLWVAITVISRTAFCLCDIRAEKDEEPADKPIATALPEETIGDDADTIEAENYSIS